MTSTPESSPDQCPDQWLIRTTANDLYGPFDRDQLIEMISEGRLKSDDEICRASHYWFTLGDAREMKEQLGLSPLKSAPVAVEEEEITETEIHLVAGSDAPPPAENAEPSGIARATKPVQITAPAKEPERAKPEHADQRVERTSVWAGLASFLIVVFLVLVYLVIRTLKKG